MIKTTLTVAIVALAFILSGATSARVDVQALKTTLKPLPGELTAKNATWGDAEFKARTLIMIMPETATSEWREMTFSFEAAGDDQGWIHLQGPWDNQERRILFDDLYFNGELVPGGDFEGDISQWRLIGKAPLQAYITADPGLTALGKKCLSVTHNGKGLIKIRIRAGENTVSVKWRQEGLAGIRAQDTPLSLEKFANVAYADDVAGDGKGGWSDQGPGNDLGNFDFSVTDFGGVSFALGEKAVTFDSPRFATNLKEIVLTPDKPARYLYLFHSSCWNQLATGQEIGEIEVTPDDGNVTKIPIKSGIDIGDWWNALDRDNAKVVYRRTAQNNVGVFLSRFPMPPGVIKNIAVRTRGNCIWILLGATLSDRSVDLAVQNFKPGREYQPVDLPAMPIKLGSALDLSRYVEPGPAGKFGQTRVSGDGQIEFAGRPGVAQRFQGFNWFAFNELTGGNRSREEQKERIGIFARQMRAAGYNMLRPLQLDGYLMEGAKQDMVFNPDQLDNFDYLFGELKKQGIYTYLTIAAYRMGYQRRLLGDEGGGYIKQKMSWGDEEMRQRWAKLAEMLLEHVNPYTNTKYKDDPAVLCVEFYNEQDLGFYNLQSLKNQQVIGWIRNQFLAYLDQVYGKGNFDPDTVTVSPGENAPYAADWARLAQERLEESHHFCEATVRRLGYRGIVTQANCVPRLYISEIAYETLSMRSCNVYFCHPRGFTKQGATCPQLSSASVGAEHMRQACSMRFPDRPLIVTEYNHGFWNRFEFEQFIFPAYAAFQKFNGISLHENAVALDYNKELGNKDFVSIPVDRASEFLGVCLYNRGDVKPAKNLVVIDYPRSFLDKKQNLEQTPNKNQTYMALMTGLAVDFPGTTPYVEPPQTAGRSWLRVPPVGGSGDIITEWFSVSAADPGGFGIRQKSIDILRQKNILPKDNLSDADKGIYQSETGELLVDTQQQMYLINTPKTVAVTSPERIRQSVSVLERVYHTVPAATALTSLDDLPLGESKHMMLVFSTIPANTGMELSADRQLMIRTGKGPVLMLTGTLEVDIRVRPGATYDLYPLAYDGTRREPVALDNRDGLLSIRLNTAELKHGPTPFFELVAQP